MKEIKVVIHGLGGVGCRILQVLNERKGVRVVAAIARSPGKLGQDAGVIAGIGPIGVIVEPDLREACLREKADVVINLASTGAAEETFNNMIPAIECGANVIEANTVITCLKQGEKEVAERADELCKKYGVSYVGMGNTQTTQRIIFALAEGVTDIKKIKFTHFADVHSFSNESNANRLGITLPIEEYRKRFSDDKPAKDKWRSDVCYGIAAKFGWTLDRVEFERKIDTDENNIVCANTSRLTGYCGDEAKIVMDWVFIMDPERRYYDRVEIDGTPYTDSVTNFPPTRGLEGTVASICNCIPYIVKANPGYISSFDIDVAVPCSDIGKIE